MLTARRAAALLVLSLLPCLGTAVSPAPARGQGPPDVTRQVRFRPGVSGVTYPGSVRGYGSVRYRIAGKKGQRLTAKLTSGSTFLYFNILSKRTGFALETTPAPREVRNWSGILPEDGDYVVQIYLVRAEARRNGKASFKLSLSLDNTAAAAPLAGTRWELVEIAYNNDTVSRPRAGERMTVVFGTGNRVTGVAGSNRFTGAYTPGPDRALKLGRLAATRMANAPGSIAGRFLKDLESANRYLFENGQLILQLPIDAGIMRFKRASE